MSLVPNSPSKRLKWVRDTYWKKDPIAVSMTYEVARHLFGLETNRALSVYFDGAADAIAGDRLDEAYAVLTEIDRTLEKSVLPRHEYDFLVPWAARELVRLNAAEAKGEVIEADREHAENLLIRKGPAIAQWAKRERKDILKVSLAEALEAVATVEHDARDGIPQGTVVYEFPDGWTVQELRGERPTTWPAKHEGLKELLSAEGDIMQHCVGGYCEAIEEGASRVYSLRDPKGRPHVTMEWQPDVERMKEGGHEHEALGSEEFLRHQMRRRGHFIQIMGKQNEPPAEKYRPYVTKFIRERFDSEPLGLYLAGVPAREIDWQKHGPRLLKDSGLDWNDADLRGANLSKMDLSNMYFVRVDFREANLAGANGRGTDFRAANFTHADMAGFDVRHADLRDADFDNAKNIHQLDFDSTTYLGMNDDRMAETFGRKWSHERGEMREVVWDPYARGYVWADEAEFNDEESFEEPEDEDDEEEDDEEEDGEQLEANPPEQVAIARRIARVLARYMPEKLAADIGNNSAGAVGLDEASTVAYCVEATLRQRIMHPGANVGGPVPPLTERQIADMLSEIDRDPKNRQDYEKLVEFWRQYP